MTRNSEKIGSTVNIPGPPSGSTYRSMRLKDGIQTSFFGKHKIDTTKVLCQLEKSPQDTATCTIPHKHDATLTKTANIDIPATDATKNMQLTNHVKNRFPEHNPNPQHKIQPSTLPTPIRIEPLASFLQTGYYDKDFIIEGFTNGFYLHHRGPNTPLISENSHTIKENMNATLEKIYNEVNTERIAGPFSHPPFKNMKISPLSLREKSEKGKFRLLHNLSYPYNEDAVNFNISDEDKKVKYETLKDAIIRTKKKPWLAKADIAEAG